MVIDTVISHLRNLFISTKSSEDDELYLIKLGLSLARTLLRPKVENAVTLSDRFQPMFVVDLIKYYEQIFPVAIGLRNKMMGNEVAKKPQRKNTRPTDMRIRRSELGIEGSVPDTEAQKILADQRRIVSQVDPSSQSPKSELVASPTSPQSVMVQSVPGTADNSPVDVRTNTQSSAEVIVPEENNKPEPSPDGNESHQNLLVCNDEVLSPTPLPPSAYSPDPVSSSHHEQPTEVAARQPSDEFDETRDAPFVPPVQSPDDPLDVPFVPPTNASFANDIISSYGASSEVDEQDIPLASKANIKRLSSHEKGGSGLNRKRGVVGSPKLRNSVGKLTQATSGSALATAPSGGSANNKSIPSVGSLRSQFEMNSSSASVTSNRQSLNSTSPSHDPSHPTPNPPTNRYRRAPSKA